jgi:hypothetical protein
MGTLHEYEVTEKDGSVTTLQLSDDDAKRLPDARKVGQRSKATGAKHDDDDAEAETKHEPVKHPHPQAHNRSRR